MSDEVADLQFNLIEGLPLDPAPLTILQALAAMIGRVLEHRGLSSQAVLALPPEQIGVDGESGPYVLHVLTAVDLDVLDGCVATFRYTILSYYFVASVVVEKAPAWELTLGWIVPVLIATLSNQTLGGMVARILPVTPIQPNTTEYGERGYHTFVVTNHVWVNYDYFEAALA